jgi:hypothetical protein
MPDSQYITPDVYVYKLGEELIISLNEDGLPKLKMSRFYLDKIREAAAQRAAGQRVPADPSRSYIKDNYSTIVATATSSTPFLITNTMLVSAGYLPTGTPATNGFGQSTCTLVLQPSANKLQGLVVTEGGTTFDDVTLGALVSLIGSSAGSVLSTNSANITGAMGGWSIPVATYDNRTNNQNRRCDGTTSGAVTGISPGTTGIARTDGTGTVGGPVAGLNTTGTLNRPGVGAPDTQSMPSTSQTARQKRRAAQRAAAAAKAAAN